MSGVDWAVYCKPICTESQRKGIQRSLSETTEKDGLTMVEQDRVRTIIRMNKARKYDAAKEFLQKMLKRFPGTGKTGLWTLHLVSVGAHGDVERSSTTSRGNICPYRDAAIVRQKPTRWADKAGRQSEPRRRAEQTSDEAK